jgi:hypothetical protein
VLCLRFQPVQQTAPDISARSRQQNRLAARSTRGELVARVGAESHI